MPKVTLEEAYSLLDPMLNDNFELLFTDIPGEFNDGAELRIKCLSASLPGASLNPVEVELFGHKLLFAGRKTFTHSMNIAYHEVYDGRTYNQLKSWASVGRATATQTGGFHDAYMRTAEFTVFDQTGADAAKWNIHRMFPTEIGEYQFEGAGGQALRQDATFAYGYVERVL